MGIKVRRIIGQAHAVIELGKKISMMKFHQITGHTGEHLLRPTCEHLLRPTAKYMKIEMTGQLLLCQYVHKQR